MEGVRLLGDADANGGEGVKLSQHVEAARVTANMDSAVRRRRAEEWLMLLEFELFIVLTFSPILI